MKANLLPVVSVFLGFSLTLVPCARGAEWEGEGELETGWEEWDTTGMVSPYAPLPSALDWGGEGDGWEGLFAIDDPQTVQPSLAADLMEVSGGLPTTEQLAAELGPVGGSKEWTAGEGEERGVREAVVGSEAGTEGRMHNVSGIPHPLAAGVAALVGLALLAGRKERLS